MIRSHFHSLFSALLLKACRKNKKTGGSVAFINLKRPTRHLYSPESSYYLWSMGGIKREFSVTLVLSIDVKHKYYLCIICRKLLFFKNISPIFNPGSRRSMFAGRIVFPCYLHGIITVIRGLQATLNLTVIAENRTFRATTLFIY